VKRRVLAIVSPPGEGGIIPQARAIQAHQPDEIILLKTYFPGRETSITSHRLNMWIRGSKDLIETYGELFDFIDLPYTPPFGFMQRPENSPPHVIEIDVSTDDFLETLQELECKYEGEDFRFDILPGSKRVVSPVLLPKSLQNTKITYSLEEGGFLILHDNGDNTRKLGPHLSIIDRFWLTGIPVYAENDGFSIGKSSELYSTMLNAQSIEFRTSKDEEREATRKRKTSPRKLLDLPLNMRNELALQQFDEFGGKIDSSSLESVKYGFKDISWEVQIEEHDFKLGNDIELIAANEIQNHWDDVVEIFQGVSFLTPNVDELKRQIESLLIRDYSAYENGPDKIHTSSRFLQRCKRLGIDILGEDKNIQLEEFVEAEIKHFCSLTQPELVQHLGTMRSAEVDILALGEFGVSMFDVKQAIWDKTEFTNPKSATQMAQNIVIREEEKRWIVNSTSPFEHPNVIHMTRLVEGRDVLGSANRSQWRPTQFNLNLLKRITQKGLLSDSPIHFQRKTGVEAKMLRRLFPELLKENPGHPIFKLKKSGKISKESFKVSVFKIQEGDSKEKAIEKIGKALVETFIESPGSWTEAAHVINRLLTTEQKKNLFGRKKFTRAMAQKSLGEYVIITGKGVNTIVRTV